MTEIAVTLPDGDGPPPGRPTQKPPAAVPAVVLDLAVPPSVNSLRRVDWQARKAYESWLSTCHKLVILNRSRNPSCLRRIPSPFEVHLMLSQEHTRMDADNAIKATVDYLKRIRAIDDDGCKHMRRLTVEWGTAEDAPEGVRVIVKPFKAESLAERAARRTFRP